MGWSFKTFFYNVKRSCCSCALMLDRSCFRQGASFRGTGGKMISIEWDGVDKCYVLASSVLLPHPRDAVFAFFSDAFQLTRITPPWLQFRIKTASPIDLKRGCLIDYRIRLHGIPIKWRTEISSWDPPYSFTDRQIRGPYRLWEHLHTFEAVEGGTMAMDSVRYRPLGGWLTNWLLVENDLRRIFEYRRQRMLELFPAGQEPEGTVSP